MREELEAWGEGEEESGMRETWPKVRGVGKGGPEISVGSLG